MKIIYLVIMALSSCGETMVEEVDVATDSLLPTAQQKEQTVADPFSHRAMIDFDGSYLQLADSLKGYVIRIFNTDLEGMKTKDIQAITFFQNANIDNLGPIDIYSIVFSRDLPEVAPKSAFLMYNGAKKQAAMLFLNKIELIKRKKSDSTQLISGQYNVRSKGYAMIYQFQNNNNEFNSVFDSRKYGECEDGVAISNASLDCISYEPFSLNFKNEDIDQDGFNDLVFTGKVNYYCEGLETNIGRKERTPRRSNPITIVFESINRPDTLYWKLVDTAICRTITTPF